MRSSIVCLCVLILTWNLCLPTPVPAEDSAAQKNLMINGSFEGGVSPWNITGTLLEDPTQSHEGAHCVFAEVTEPNRSHSIKQSVTLSPTALYRLTFWVRATNRAKVAVWIQGQNGRHNLAQLENMPATWSQQTVKFSVPQPGKYELQLAAPSSHGRAPAGKMWIDDVCLFETILPPTLNLTMNKGFSDRPALAADGRGEVFVGWISFEDGQDNLCIAKVPAQASAKPDPVRPWRVALPQNTDVESISLLSSPLGVWLAAGCEVRQNWEILLAHCSDSGPGAVTNLTQHPATDIRPTLAYANGAIHLAWESNRDGNRQVYLGEVHDSRLTDVRRISNTRHQNFNPFMAADGASAWLVWESFRDHNYDIFGAQFLEGAWQSEQRLTSDPRIEHRPVVSVRNGQAWMAWEVITVPQFRTSSSQEHRTVVAKIGPDGLYSPPNIYSLFPNWTQMPTLAFDQSGCLWVAARASRGKSQGWDAVLRRFDGRAWSPEQAITLAQGRAQRCPIVAVRDRLLAAVQTDTIPSRWPNVEASASAVSNIEIPIVRMQVVRAEQPQLLPFNLPQSNLNLATVRLAWGEDAPRHSIEYMGRTLNLYFGQFHEHSDISVCNRRGDLPPEDNFTHNRDIHAEDFSATTDHDYNMNAQLWHYTGKLARTLHDPARFVTFLAEEWTSTFEEYSREHPYGFYGHRNLIFGDPHFPRWFNAYNRDTPRQVWDSLHKDKANFIAIPHQLADTGNVPTDWNFTDETAQPVAEIFQTRQSYEHKGAPRQAKNTADGYFLQDAWAKGIVIGVIASPDHGGGQGKAAIYAPELTRDAILDACRARHTYGTSGAKTFLDVRVNGHLMGEKQPAQSGPVQVSARVIAPSEIERVDVCRNNVFVYTRPGNGRETSFTYEDSKPLTATAYYYVRVVQKDGELAWSSPVWLTR